MAILCYRVRNTSWYRLKQIRENRQSWIESFIMKIKHLYDLVVYTFPWEEQLMLKLEQKILILHSIGLSEVYIWQGGFYRSFRGQEQWYIFQSLGRDGFLAGETDLRSVAETEKFKKADAMMYVQSILVQTSKKALADGTKKLSSIPSRVRHDIWRWLSEHKSAHIGFFQECPSSAIILKIEVEIWVLFEDGRV